MSRHLNAITNTIADYNSAILSYSPVGNVVDHNWCHQIKTKSGRIDPIAILLLAEIVYWYRPKNTSDSLSNAKVKKFLGDAWQTSYKHLSEKLSCNNQRIRRALINLERLGVAKRELRHIHLRGQKYNNILFIKLNENYFNNNSTQPNSFTKRLPDNGLYKTVDPSLQNRIDYKDKETKKRLRKNRSIESNFINTFQEKKTTELIQQKHPQKFSLDPAKEKVSITSKIKINKFKRKKLEEFLPISEAETIQLKNLSKREFSCSYINKLATRLARKYPAHSFYGKELFIKYMAKALVGELRETTQVNSINFQFAEDKRKEQKERYFDEIKSSKKTTPEIQLKRKIIGGFSDETAYNLLKSCQFLEPDIENQDEFKIILTKKIDLSLNMKSLLLEKVREIWKNTKRLKFINELSSDDNIKKDKIVMSEKYSNLLNDAKKKFSNLSGSASLFFEIFLNNYEGDFVHWIAKLNFVSYNEGIIVFEAPSAFYRDWIDNNLHSKINVCGRTMDSNFKSYRILVGEEILSSKSTIIN